MRLTLPEKSAIINMLSVFICGCGGIGRRTRFRIWRLTAWGFKSLNPHKRIIMSRLSSVGRASDL